MTPGLFAAQTLDAAASDAPVGDAAGLADTVTSTSPVWAMATDWSTCVALGDTHLELRTYKLLRVEVEKFGDFRRETREVCAVLNTALLGQTTVFPPALIASMAKMVVTSAHGTDGSYVSGLEAQIFGMHMAKPLSEGMPTDGADPRVYDSDGDGHPGATLQVGTLCQLYQANRAISMLHGKVVSPVRIEGGAVHQVSQANLGGTSAFCTKQYATTELQAENRFALVRAADAQLDSDADGNVTCAEIIAGQAHILTRREADNDRCEKK